ncbi:hypothetical protein HELRODRAFT_184598 [Helobdella robusta]|uniref:C-type lectin domain-containing protein n=1 Tax=Helobdella robusta TaxID=6412 RepID=T1FLJ8_HELRO|nr:hypothetical protein HELRODRAFT_184598 [Helobdella robusta]ESO09170.1 hypothetical protein HELRODRAFT_184598 [Helobdella robusta]
MELLCFSSKLSHVLDLLMKCDSYRHLRYITVGNVSYICSTSLFNLKFCKMFLLSNTMKLIFLIFGFNLFDVHAELSDGKELKSLCNDRYCLYSNGTSTSYTSVDEMRGVCTGWNMSVWLLEVYDAELQNLTERFIDIYNFKDKNIPLNMRRNTQGWMWINNQPLLNQTSITNQYETRSVSYMLKSPNSDKVEYLGAGNENTCERAICQILKTTNCKTSESLQYKNFCYLPILREPMYWHEAQNECIKLNGTLAVFDGMDLNSYNKTWVQSLVADKYLIGLARGQFMWDHSNSFVNFSQWRDRNLNLSFSCPVIYNLKVWVNLNCPRYSYVVVCMKENPNISLNTGKSLIVSGNYTTPSTTSAIINVNITKDPGFSTKLGEQQNINSMAIGIGVGVSLFVLLSVAVVVLVVCLWRKKKMW